MYLSIHCERHLSSELPSEVPGFVTHLEKHFSLIFYSTTNASVLVVLINMMSAYIN